MDTLTHWKRRGIEGTEETLGHCLPEGTQAHKPVTDIEFI